MKTPITPIFAAYRNGLAQRMVWLMQSGRLFMGPAGLPACSTNWCWRCRRMRNAWRGWISNVDIADTRAIVHLTTITAFGDAILGKRLRRAQSPDDEISQRAWFENWFGEMLNVYMTRKG